MKNVNRQSKIFLLSSGAGGGFESAVRIFLILMASFISFCSTAALGCEQLLLAIEQVESGGRTNAVGDGGNALGCLQIHKCVVDDVNRIVGRKTYTYQDRKDRDKSFAMARIYLGHYGKGKTFEQQARIWNGGPKGHKKQATLVYAAKIKKAVKAK